jgi:hypothetical protein
MERFVKCVVACSLLALPASAWPREWDDAERLSLQRVCLDALGGVPPLVAQDFCACIATEFPALVPLDAWERAQTEYDPAVQVALDTAGRVCAKVARAKRGLRERSI